MRFASSGLKKDTSTASDLRLLAGRHGLAARERPARMPAHLCVGIAGRELVELVQNRGREPCAPRRLARPATKRVGRVLPNARNRIIEHGRDRSDRSRIGTVIEDLDAPPPDTGIPIAEPLNERVEHRLGRTGRPQVRHRCSAHQCLEGIEFGGAYPKNLDEFLLASHG